MASSPRKSANWRKKAASAVQDIDTLISDATLTVTAGVAAARRCSTTMDRIGAAAADNKASISGHRRRHHRGNRPPSSRFPPRSAALHRIGEENAAAAGQIDRAMAEVAEMADRLKIKTDVLILA